MGKDREVSSEEKLLAEKISGMEDKLDNIEHRLKLLEILATKGTPGIQQEAPQQQDKKVIQINANGRKYICITQEQLHIFKENNPGVKMETYTIEMPDHIIDKYMNDPENKKQLTKKEETIGVTVDAD